MKSVRFKEIDIEHQRHEYTVGTNLFDDNIRKCVITSRFPPFVGIAHEYDEDENIPLVALFRKR